MDERDRMDEKSRTAASKFLSYVLRHEPAAVGIALDAAGWVAVDVLLDACAQHGRRLSRAELQMGAGIEIVPAPTARGVYAEVAVLVVEGSGPASSHRGHGSARRCASPKRRSHPLQQHPARLHSRRVRTRPIEAP